MDASWTLKSLSSFLDSTLASRAHFGVLVPWANYAIESELPYIMPQNVTWHFARLVPATNSTELDQSFLQAMVDATRDSVFSLSKLNLSGIAFGCTSAGFSYPGQLSRMFGTANEETPVLTAFEAIVDVLAYVGAARITLITPYEEWLTEIEVAAFAKAGIDIATCKSLGYKDRIDSITADEIVRAYQGCRNSKPDAVVLSCTAMHTLEAIYQIENATSIPVISSNTAMCIGLALKYLDRRP